MLVEPGESRLQPRLEAMCSKSPERNGQSRQ
jgi:hypothetical protein